MRPWRKYARKLRQRQIAMRAGGRFRGRQGGAEGQLLEAVQGVVVHEIADRGLGGQDRFQTMQQVQQARIVCRGAGSVAETAGHKGGRSGNQVQQGAG
jgi:hypothetical protein